MSTAQAVQDAVDNIKSQASPEDEVVNEEAQAEVEELNLVEEQAIETDDSPAIDAPNSWSSTEKEHFSTLPPDIQASLALRERERDLNIRKGQDETAAQRKAIEADKEAVNKQRLELSERLKSGSRKPSTDMLDPEHESYDSDGYHAKLRKYEDGLKEAKKLDNELNLEDVEKRKVWQEKEIKVYQDVLPQFVDKEKGPAFRQKLAEYAVKTQGITMEDAVKAFPITPASQMVILDKARKYDEAVAKQKSAKKTPKPKTLAGGSSNPKPEQKTDMKSAIANFKSNNDGASAAALLGLNKK